MLLFFIFKNFYKQVIFLLVCLGVFLFLLCFDELYYFACVLDGVYGLFGYVVA